MANAREQTTHVNEVDDQGRRYLRQVVSAAELRRILRRQGESTARPKDFGPLDEWLADSEAE